MPKVVEIPIPIRLDKLTEVMRIKGVSVYAHWTVFLIAAIILLGGLHRPVVGIVAMISYLAVILIHECGHLIAAQRMNCEVFSIKLYPNSWSDMLPDAVVPFRSLRNRLGWSGRPSGSSAASGCLGQYIWLHAVRGSKCRAGNPRVFQPGNGRVQSSSDTPTRWRYRLGVDTRTYQAGPGTHEYTQPRVEIDSVNIDQTLI